MSSQSPEDSSVEDSLSVHFMSDEFSDLIEEMFSEDEREQQWRFFDQGLRLTDLWFRLTHDCHETDVHQESAAAERSDVFSVIDKNDEVLKESLCAVDCFLQHHYEEVYH